MSQPSPVPTGRVLAIDDDQALLENFRWCLEAAGHKVTLATSLAEGLRLAASQPFHVCLLDRRLGTDDGADALARLRDLAPALRVVMVTAHSRVEDAVAAIAQGASDYLVKPCSPEQLRIAVARQLDARRLQDRLDSLERDRADDPPAGLASRNAAMAALLETARSVARTDANVLLLGESGSGKGELARAMHAWSARATAPMATVNCPSLSSDLLESELFGHARGAFTGASQSTQGRLGNADGGTLFLDEIGDFPLALQPRLLRFIEDKAYERIGDPTPRRADVRIIAASNRDLAAMAARGEFRADLLYRLDVVSLVLPPLRERPEDIEDLALAFLRRFARRYHRPARAIAPEALARLRAHAWPGNVRELQNLMERAVILGNEEMLGTDLLSPALPPGATAESAAPASLEALERQHIARVLAEAPTLDAAARSLGIDASTLYRKRKAYGL